MKGTLRSNKEENFNFVLFMKPMKKQQEMIIFSISATWKTTTTTTKKKKKKKKKNRRKKKNLNVPDNSKAILPSNMKLTFTSEKSINLH